MTKGNSKNNNYYVDPEELKREIRKAKANDGQISEELGEMFLKIAKKFCNRHNFYSYTYKEDFVSEALYRMVKYFHKIDLDHPKCNVFGYLSRVVEWAAIDKIVKERKYTELKKNITEEIYSDFVGSEDIHSRPDKNDLDFWNEENANAGHYEDEDDGIKKD